MVCDYVKGCISTFGEEKQVEEVTDELWSCLGNSFPDERHIVRKQ